MLIKTVCCLSFSGRKLFNYGIIKLIFLALYLHFNCSHIHFIFNSLQQFDILWLENDLRKQENDLFFDMAQVDVDTENEIKELTAKT